MKIIGTGSALPALEVTNDMLANYIDTNDEWITERTGIKSRHLITTENLIDLAAEASRKAIDMAGIDPKEIDYIICSNVANNFVTPAMSCIVEGMIGADCPCVDLNGACTGFIFALDFSEGLLRTNRAKNILIISAEEPSKFCNWANRDTTILFGDGAGAVVITRSDENLLSIKMATKSKYESLYYQRKMELTPFDKGTEMYNPLVMDGRDVFRLAVSSSIRDIDEVLKLADISSEDVDLFVLHQANLRIIESIRKHLNQPIEKFPTNLQHTGNTSSASIPILLDELIRADKIQRGNTLVFSAFGAGFATGACVLKY